MSRGQKRATLQPDIHLRGHTLSAKLSVELGQEEVHLQGGLVSECCVRTMRVLQVQEPVPIVLIGGGELQRRPLLQDGLRGDE